MFKYKVTADYGDGLEVSTQVNACNKYQAIEKAIGFIYNEDDEDFKKVTAEALYEIKEVK
jgi:hypothetical protein